jgi:hypothetical protein
MKKFTLFFTFCGFLMVNLINAQTVVWSSDLSDLTGWSIYDGDGDGENWIFYSGGGDNYGMTGDFTASYSWSSDLGALTPSNYLYTPVVAIPAEATDITFKMKVVSISPNYFAEKFAVYVFDSDLFIPQWISIHSETLTEGGAGTAKDVSIAVPATFAGKNVEFVVRHYDCTYLFGMYMDDFEVSYGSALSTEDNITGEMSIYPNSVKDIVTINTDEVINNITIVNQLGQIVQVIKEKEMLNNTVNLSNLSSGLYFMSIKVEKSSQSFKIIKE